MGMMTIWFTGFLTGIIMTVVSLAVALLMDAKRKDKT